MITKIKNFNHLPKLVPALPGFLVSCIKAALLASRAASDSHSAASIAGRTPGVRRRVGGGPWDLLEWRFYIIFKNNSNIINKNSSSKVFFVLPSDGSPAYRYSW